MADTRLQTFTGRVQRIETSFREGKGFEAAGTLGRSHYRQRTRRRFAVLGPVLVVVLGVIGLKAGIHHAIGGGNYDKRVQELWQGDLADRLGAALMQADPATLYLSSRITQILK